MAREGQREQEGGKGRPAGEDPDPGTVTKGDQGQEAVKGRRSEMEREEISTSESLEN